MHETITAAQLAEQLREAGRKLASGEMNEVKLPLSYLLANMTKEENDKVTPSYMRTTINRVPEVREIGSTSIRKVAGDEGEVYIITLVPMTETRKSQRRTLTPDEQRRLKSHAAALELKRFADYVSPVMLTATSGEMFEGARLAIYQFQQAIKDRINELEAE